MGGPSLCVVTVVTFVDETTGGGDTGRWGLELPEQRVTLRELIRRRIYQEAAEFNAAQSSAAESSAAGRTEFRGLVQPAGTERTLTGYRVKQGRRIDPEKQFTRAVEAFGRNGFAVLTADRQLLSLDEEIDLAQDAELTFLKLVPLVGG